jgi:type II secretory pathway pseudopilin PulG
MNIGLIFGMVVAIFVIGMVIAFGYQQVQNMQQMQENAEVAKTLQNFEAAVERVYAGSGETSEQFAFTFPSGVYKVCFIPAYRQDSTSSKKGKLAEDFRSVIDGSTTDQYQLSSILLNERIGRNPGDWREVDKNQTLLIFYHSSSVPEFLNVPYLEPSKNDYDEVLCVSPNSRVWLQRRFDSSGAWVDVEEA